MKSNYVIRSLCSIPFIMMISYFIPIIGVCLLITRYFVYDNKRFNITSVILCISGILIVVPQLIIKIAEIMKIENTTILYVDAFINADIYPSMLDYSKFLIGSGILFFLLSMIVNRAVGKGIGYIKNYRYQQEQIQMEVTKQEYIKMQEKREKAKQTRVVYCPYCGADNILNEAVGSCKYCRRSLK